MTLHPGAGPTLSGMTLSTTLRIVRASAIWDLVVTWGFALPITVGIAFDTLRRLHDSLGLSGALPSVDAPFTVLFANLMGSLVVVWATVRVIRPSLALGAADTVARGLFSIAMVAALADGASTLLVGFLVAELGWGIVQGTAVLAASRRRRATLSPTLTP